MIRKRMANHKVWHNGPKYKAFNVYRFYCLNATMLIAMEDKFHKRRRGTRRKKMAESDSGLVDMTYRFFHLGCLWFCNYYQNMYTLGH